MASGLYDTGRAAFLGADVDWLADDIRVILVDTGAYTVNLATHDFLDDVPAGARIAVSGALASKSATAGVADAADVVFSAVTGVNCEAVIIYKHTGTDATSQLILYSDAYSGLPVLPNGQDITLVHDNGANKIFKL